MFDDLVDRRKQIAEHLAFHLTKSTRIADIWGNCGCAPQLCSIFHSAEEEELGTRKLRTHLNPATASDLSSVHG